MSSIQILAAQSNPSFSLTPQQQATIDLSKFLRNNKFVDFTYDGSQVLAGKSVSIFSKTVGTREITGEIFKRDDGKDIFKLVVEEKNDQTKQQFENNSTGIYAGLKIRGTRQVVSRTQIAKLPSPKWGALIVLELDKSGVYELLIGGAAKP